jgi:hypothetical protein
VNNLVLRWISVAVVLTGSGRAASFALPDAGVFSATQIIGGSDSQYHFSNLLGTPINFTGTVGFVDGSDPNLFALASTDQGTNRAQAGSILGSSAWAGSYWADTVTLTGGAGTADVAFHLSLQGSITGNGAVRYRYSLATPFASFPFNSATDPNTDFPGNAGPYPDVSNAFDLLFNGTSFGAVTDPGGYGFGIEIDTGLDYGTTYMLQVFLETYSTDGGAVDFFDPGHFDAIDIPFAGNVTFGSGNTDVSVNVANSPEPAAILLILPVLASFAIVRRRRNSR